MSVWPRTQLPSADAHKAARALRRSPRAVVDRLAREWRACRNQLRSHWRSDSALLSAIDRGSELGRRTAQLRRQHGSELAVKEVVRHFTERCSPRFYFDPARRSELVALCRKRWGGGIEATVRSADAVCRGYFPVFGKEAAFLGETVPWRTSPDTGARWPNAYWECLPITGPRRPGDIDLVWELNQHSFCVALGKAYWYTDESRFANRLADLVRSWLDDNPTGLGPNWISPLQVGIRLIAWSWAWHYLREAPELDEALRADLLKSAHAHLDFINRHLPVRQKVPNNHLLTESAALLILSLLYPEFASSKEWTAHGMDLLAREMRRQVLPDGVHSELCTAYHRMVIDFVTHAVILCERNGVACPPIIHSHLEAMYGFVLRCTRADGTVPMFGDWSPGALDRFHSRWDDWRSLLAVGACLFGRADFREASGEPSEEAFWLFGEDTQDRFNAATTQPERPVAYSFPDAGYFIMSAGKEDSDLHLMVDAGPIGLAGRPGHGHADCLSFELFAHGQPLIVDAGTYTYSGRPDERDHFRGTGSHNTLLVDGVDQAQATPIFGWQHPYRALVHHWVSDVTGAFLDAEHSGYTRLMPPVVHRRQVLVASGDYVVVRDVITGEGMRSLKWRFQLSPGAWTVEKHGHTFHAHQTAAGLLLAAVCPPETVCAIASGRVSRRYWQAQAAPALEYHLLAELPLSVWFIVQPLSGSATPMLATRPVSVSAHEDGGADTPCAMLELVAPSWTDLVLLPRGTGSGCAHTPGVVGPVWCRYGPDGQVAQRWSPKI